MNIELMKETDCEKTAALFKQCFADPWSLSALQEMFRVGDYLSFLAQKEGEILGYIGMKCVCGEAEITNVAVAPLARRQGMAAALLKRLLQEAREREIGRIYLEVRESNEPAIQLYQQAGFQKNGRRKGYYTHPKEDALLMIWKER